MLTYVPGNAASQVLNRVPTTSLVVKNPIPPFSWAGKCVGTAALIRCGKLFGSLWPVTPAVMESPKKIQESEAPAALASWTSKLIEASEFPGDPLTAVTFIRIQL